MVIKSDLKGHSIPSPPVIAAQGQEMTPKITRLSLLADLPTASILALLPTPLRAYCVVIMFTLGHPAPRMAGSCSGIQGKWGMLPPGDSMEIWAVNRDCHVPSLPLAPHHHPLNSQHSTNPENRKRILILEAKKGACQSLSDMARRCQALCPWTPSPTQGKRAFP